MAAMLGGMGLVMGLVMLVVMFAIQTIFVFLAAKWMGAGRTSFGACFIATVVVFIASLVVGGALTFVLPGIGSILSIIVSLALSGFIFSKMLDATFGKGVMIALIASVLATIVAVVLALVFGLAVGGGIAALGGLG